MRRKMTRMWRWQGYRNKIKHDILTTSKGLLIDYYTREHDFSNYKHAPKEK